MADKKKLDKTAKALLAIFEEHARDFSPAEQETKWRAFSRVVAKVGTRAKRREQCILEHGILSS